MIRSPRVPTSGSHSPDSGVDVETQRYRQNPVADEDIRNEFKRIKYNLTNYVEIYHKNTKRLDFLPLQPHELSYYLTRYITRWIIDRVRFSLGARGSTSRSSCKALTFEELWNKIAYSLADDDHTPAKHQLLMIHDEVDEFIQMLQTRKGESWDFGPLADAKLISSPSDPMVFPALIAKHREGAPPRTVVSASTGNEEELASDEKPLNVPYNKDIPPLRYTGKSPRHASFPPKEKSSFSVGVFHAQPQKLGMVVRASTGRGDKLAPAKEASKFLLNAEVHSPKSLRQFASPPPLSHRGKSTFSIGGLHEQPREIVPELRNNTFSTPAGPRSTSSGRTRPASKTENKGMAKDLPVNQTSCSTRALTIGVGVVGDDEGTGHSTGDACRRSRSGGNAPRPRPRRALCGNVDGDEEECIARQRRA